MTPGILSGLVRDFGNLFFLRIMRRYVAGSSAKEAVDYCASLGSPCMINLLGEHYRSSAQADRAVEEYEKLCDEIRSRGIDASITIKPSQFGFEAEDVRDPERFCGRKMLEAVSYASERGIPVWLDMEDSRFTDFTIGFYKKNREKHDLGICLQANLNRTESDLDSLMRLSGKVKVRLVKGIYPEKPGKGIADPGNVHRRFLRLIRKAFEESPETFGIAVGSHHSEAIELALRLQQERRKGFFQIQVLKGVLPDYYRGLRSRGVTVVEYVPYGKEAFAYSVRRALKNPGFARSILFGIFFDAYKKLYS